MDQVGIDESREIKFESNRVVHGEERAETSCVSYLRLRIPFLTRYL